MNKKRVFIAVPLMVIVMAGLAPACGEASSSSVGSAPGESPEPSPSSREVDGCPVTIPPQPPFVAPPPYPKRFPNPNVPDADDGVWYGSADLWTILDSSGAVWRDLPIGKDGHVGDKTLWFSEKFSTAKGEDFGGNPDITVTVADRAGSGTRVDQEGGVPSFNEDIKNFLLVGLTVPEPGCWEVTARYQGAELSYVMLVKG